MCASSNIPRPAALSPCAWPCRSEAVRDFASYLMNANIAVSTKLVFRVSGLMQASPHQAHRHSVGALVSAQTGNTFTCWASHPHSHYVATCAYDCAVVERFVVLAACSVQIAGGYYGNKNAAAEVAPASEVATTAEAGKGKGWPVRLLTAYIVRPGECELTLATPCALLGHERARQAQYGRHMRLAACVSIAWGEGGWRTAPLGGWSIMSVLLEQHTAHTWCCNCVAVAPVTSGEHCGFVKAWKKMEEKVGGSKGLVALSLNKPAGEPQPQVVVPSSLLGACPGPGYLGCFPAAPCIPTAVTSPQLGVGLEAASCHWLPWSLQVGCLLTAARVYCLCLPFCPSGDNILFTSYAHFESPSALWSLGEKKAVKQFLEYVSDNHITVVTKKMWKIPEPKW